MYNIFRTHFKGILVVFREKPIENRLRIVCSMTILVTASQGKMSQLRLRVEINNANMCDRLKTQITGRTNNDKYWIMSEYVGHDFLLFSLRSIENI